MKKLTAESVISLYRSDEDFGFILDIEDVIKFLDDKSKDDEAQYGKISGKEKASILFEIMKHNNGIHAKCEALQKPKEKEVKEVQSSSLEEKEIEPITTTNICDVSSLVKNICGCKGDANLIRALLPKPTNPNYKKIINAIILEIKKKETEDTEFVRDPENTEFKKDALEAIANYYSTSEVIKTYDQEMQEIAVKEGQKENKVEEGNTLKNIIFLMKPSGNYYIDDDLKNIEEKDKLTELLWNVKNNSIPEIKRYNNPELKDLLGARDHKSRVFFMYLDKNTVVIAGLMIKHFQNNEAFNDMLIARAKRFEEQKEALRLLATNPEFMQEQERILSNVIISINNISGKKKVTARD